MFTPFDFSAPKNVLFTLLCNRLTLSVPDEGNSRNASCAIH